MSSKELIIAACEKGDLSQLWHVLGETELDVGSEPLGSEGETALHVACAHGHLDIVQYLVNDRGCSVAVPNSRAVGATPLEVAWANEHWEVVEFLLKAIQGKELFAEVGLAPTTVTQLQEVAQYGDEALHQACTHGYLEVAKFLMCSSYLYQMNKGGLNPTAVGSHGTTPLQVAWENKHWEVALYILQAMGKWPRKVLGLSSATLTQLLEVASFGEDAFHAACSRGNLQVVQYIHESLKCSLTQCDSQGKTPLEIARLNGQLYVVHFLLESGKCSAPDMTELHIACMGRDKEKVKNLASDITSLSTPDQYGITAVHYATCQPKNLHILVSIAEQKHRLSLLVRQDGRGNTPLHYAASCGRTKSVKSLVSYYKSVDMQNSDGDTPLHLFIKSSYYHSGPVREILLHESCNPSIVNAHNETALHIGLQYDKLQSAELLLSTGKCSPEDIKETIEVNLLLHQAVATKRFGLVQVLLNVPGCNINGFNSDGETPLHVACRSDFEIFELLTEDSRCDLNAQNKDGLTALHITITRGLIKRSRLLLTNVNCNPKCNPNIVNGEGNSALHLAVRKGLIKCARYLLQHERIDSNIQNKAGNTPLNEVIITGAPIEIMEFLIQHKNTNPNVRNNEGNSALHLAVRKHSILYTTHLLQHDRVDPNIQNQKGNTSLHEAVITGAPVDVVEALTLHKSCNPSIANNGGKTPLQISIASGKLDYAEVLITSEKCSHEDIVKATEGTLLLHQAVLSNRFKSITESEIKFPDDPFSVHTLLILRNKKSFIMLEQLVKNSRCDFNTQDQHGNTALHLAVYNGTDVGEKVQCILQSEKCNPNISNSDGYTPLHVAMIKKDFETAVILLHHSQCNPNIQDLTGNTPLHIAIIGKSFANIKSFLNHKNIDLNIQNINGNTPLHEAVMRQVPVDVVEGLTLHKSCNPNIANNAGMTPLQIAADFEELNYAEVIITSGKCSHEDIVKATEGTLLLHKALLSNRPKLFFRLSKFLECNMNETNSAGNTVLHLACITNHNKGVLKKLVQDSRCNLNVCNQHGDTALHFAVYSGTDVSEKVQCILQSERCNPNITNSEGHTPLHVAVKRKKFQSTAILLKHPKCNPNSQNIHGNTALHMAIFNNTSLPNLQHFLNHKDIDLNIQNREGNTPLHVAVIRQVPVNVVTALVLHSSCNPSIANAEGMTPLQIAVDSQQMETAKAIITSRKCSCEDIERANKDAFFLFYAVSSDNVELLTALINAGVDISKSNSKGETALHATCKEGNIKATQLLLQSGADVLAVDCKGNAPIHVACANVNLECLSLILDHKRCNPNQQNAVGDTPLHIVCSYGWNCDIRMFRTLLSTPGISIECANHAGQIPAELAKSNYFVIDEISNYLKHKNTKLETYLKIFVVGNSGGGKSTLIKAVTTERSKSFKNSFKAKNVKPSEVPPHTAGIVPLSFNSKHFGHAVLYDFAGQHEYYSSHAAVMENLVLPSPPLFLLLIDISKPMEEIKEELVYWWMFINNHSKRATAPPHVILVGSHKDTVKDSGGNVQKIMEEITDIVRDIPVSFQFDHSRAFPLDCRKLVSQGLTALLAQLKLTCQTLRQTADIDLHCHILKAFLTTNFHSSIACEVSEIAEKTNPEDDLLPQVPSQLIPLLSTLSDKGYILLLQNHTDVSKSWVVLQPEVLLTEVNGSIFAPDNFKEHCRGFAMSTGVVALSKIREKFGEPNNQVIVGYLTHLEFCFRIKDQHTLEMITKDATLQLPTYDSENAEEYYFFPVLVQKENPSDVYQPQETIKYECGWFYRCNEPTEQLTTRFLHVLILRLAFSCDPPDEPTERESVVLLRSCSVWKHGIAWWTNDGIETIVEVGLQCRWVAVMLRCPDTRKVQCAELRTKVINTVLKTKQDFCPAIGMKEFLIAPSSLQYPFEGKNLLLYNMREIARVVMKGDKYPKNTKGKSAIHISQLLPFEPFFGFDNLIDSFFAPDQRELSLTKPNFIKMANICHEKLDDFKKALKPDPFAFQRECVKSDCTEVDRCVALFQIIQRRGCKTWRDFEQEFSRFSIFCGRHPMVSLML